MEKSAHAAATVEEVAGVMVEEGEDMEEAGVEVEATVGEEDTAVEAMVAAETGTEAMSKIVVQSLSKRVKRLT